MSSSAQSRNGVEYLYGINVLRGCLALSVLFWHYQHFWLGDNSYDFAGQPLFPVFRTLYTRGHQAVPVFWMVSGVVLGNAYLRTLDKSDLRSFTQARIARLYPLHLLTLAAVAALQLLGSGVQIYEFNDMKHFILNLLFVPSWGFEDGASFNAPIWSVSIEVPIYILFAVAISRVRQQVRNWLLIALFVFFTVVSLDEYKIWKLSGLNPDFAQCAKFFFAGTIISLLVRVSGHLFNAALASAASVGFALVGFFLDKYLLLLAIPICVMAVSGGRLLSFLQMRPLRMFGELTYSVFLCHIPIQIVMRWVMIQRGVDNRWFGSIWLLLSYLALTYAIGYLSYRFVEEPARRLLRQAKSDARRATNQAS